MEDQVLKSIFKDKISIYSYQDTKTYQILFNNKYYEFITDKDYPGKLPMMSTELSEEVTSKYINKPMIYHLLFECVKSTELNLEKDDEIVSVITYDEVDRITEEQFMEYKMNNMKIRDKKLGISGREIFLNKKE